MFLSEGSCWFTLATIIFKIQSIKKGYQTISITTRFLGEGRLTYCKRKRKKKLKELKFRIKGIDTLKKPDFCFLKVAPIYILSLIHI